MRLLLSCVLVVAACGSDSPGDDDGPIGGANTVTGNVVDFETGAVISGAASVSTSGVLPAPRVTTEGAAFTIEGIPDNSTFQILASVTPTHRATFGPSIAVLDADITGVEAPAVSETFLATVANAFSVTPSAATGVLIGQLIDSETGMPLAGVPKGELVLAGGVSGPFLLDQDLAPAPNATVTSASGYVVFFEVPAGLVELGQAAAPTVTLDMPASPIQAGTVTLTTIAVTSGAPPPAPTNVSFSQDVDPIFHNRGCVECHSGGGIGKELGGLKLDGPVNQAFTELMEDPTRVRTDMPELSLVLRMPSRENPPDQHPNVTFASAADPDYQTILAWIKEGAKNN